MIECLFENLKDIIAAVWSGLLHLIFRDAESTEHYVVVEPFSASEYLTRMEQANLELLEQRKPVDQTVILWWGLDGLRLNEDGTLEWISRKKPEPVKENVFCTPPNAILQVNHPLAFQMQMCQNTRATIDALQAQTQMQVSYPGYYAPYFHSLVNCAGTIFQ